MFVTILVSIERRCWVHFEHRRVSEWLGLRISFEVCDIFGGTWHFDQIDKKKIIWQLSSQKRLATLCRRLIEETSDSSKVNANAIFTLPALFPHHLCTAIPSLHRSTSFVREEVTICCNAFSIYISPWLLRYETLACKRHYSRSPWPISHHCWLIEVSRQQPRWKTSRALWATSVPQ